MQHRSIRMTVPLALFLLLGGRPAVADQMQEYNLRIAAGAGDLATVVSLLSGNIDVNSKSARGYTALHTAVRGNHVPIVSLLIAAAADVNAQDDDGDSPLLLAIANKNRVIVELLLQHDANVNSSDKKGVTPLIKAAALDNIDIITLLLQKRANVNAADKNGFTALMMAARAGRTDIAKELISAGADVNAQTPLGQTALTLAKQSRHAALVTLLSPTVQSESPLAAPSGGDKTTEPVEPERRTIPEEERSPEDMPISPSIGE